VSLLALSSASLAQHLTWPPCLGGIVAAADPSDEEYQFCGAVDAKLQACVSSAGGTLGLETADPTSLLSCGCCISCTPLRRRIRSARAMFRKRSQGIHRRYPVRDPYCC